MYRNPFILVFATSGEAAHAAALDRNMEDAVAVLGRTHATLMKVQRPGGPLHIESLA